MSIVEIKLDLKRGLGFWWINFYKFGNFLIDQRKEKQQKGGQSQAKQRENKSNQPKKDFLI